MFNNKALVVVDVQLDFCEGGALAVAGGNQVAENIAQFITACDDAFDEVVFTRDWHNPLPDTNGGHFSDTPDFVDSWPVHCVAGSLGADFHPAISELAWKYPHKIFSKGQGSPDYSGFQGVNGRGQTLAEFLDQHYIEGIYVCGLAGDYCVRHTAADAIFLGYKTDLPSVLTASVGGDLATLMTLAEIERLQCTH